MEKCQQRRRKGELQKTEETTDKAASKAKKEYLESIREEFTEFQRTDGYVMMYMKTKELGWEDNLGIENAGKEDSQGNIIIDH